MGKTNNNAGILPVVHTFEIIRKDNKGRIVRDDNEEPMIDEYVYDFEKMSIDRMLSARKLFFISNKEYSNTPKIQDELEALTTREAERKAFAAILMKKIGEDEFEDYDPYSTNSFDFLKVVKGSENFQKILECQDHFFLKVGLVSPELMGQSADIMTQSMNILGVMGQLKDTAKGESWELLKELLKDTSPQEMKKE